MNPSALIENPYTRVIAAQHAGFSPARVARMQTALRRHVDSGAVPGLVALVARRDQEHVEAIGTMGFDTPTPIQRNTLFRLAPPGPACAATRHPRFLDLSVPVD